MRPTRREALAALGLAGAAGLPSGAMAGQGAAADPPGSGWREGIEGQRRADLGDGSFLNPVLSGDRPDPSLLKDGEDYYAAFSTFLHYPGIKIWHSRDLVNWVPLGPALSKPLGSVWAVDLVKHDGRYFIYIPIFNANDPSFAGHGIPCRIFVVHAPSMAGPWSEPIDMDIVGSIDPGHAVGEDGKRYLFLNGGGRVPISDDGLRCVGPAEHVYDGWPIPADWVIEAVALEGPKLLRKDGWFYMFSGQGGTAGPPTSHMVIVARSRSIHGPWQNCPDNPIVRTASAAEPWWSRGHATPVQGPEGDWWMAYHGYENGFRTLGRQMLLDPIEWTADGWPRAKGGLLGSPIAKPRPAMSAPAGQPLSGPFKPDDFGPRCAFFAPRPGYLDRAGFDDGRLILTAQGEGPAESSPITFIAGDRSYEFEVEIALEDGAEAGLLLFYDERLFCGLGAEAEALRAYKHGQPLGYPSPGPAVGAKLGLRVRNEANVASFFIRPQDGPWRLAVSLEVSGYNHNMADGFMSLRPALFATRAGRASFSGVRYRGWN